MTVWSDDYGMCCGETEARQNAREYSRQRRQEQREFDLRIRCLFIGAGIIGGVVLSICLLCNLPV